MNLRDALAEAQQEPIDRHLQKIDDAFGKFLETLDAQLVGHLIAVREGGSPANPRVAVSTTQSPRPNYDDLKDAMSRIRELPSYKSLVDYCANPERDARCDLTIMYIPGSAGGYNHTDVSFEIRPAEAFSESTISAVWDHKEDYCEKFAKHEEKPASKAAEPLPPSLPHRWRRLPL
jgi:hypothetical protein